MDASYPLEELRNELPVLREWTYLNTGTVGVMPTPVLNAHLQNIADYDQGGHPAQAGAVEVYERSRTTLASLLNVPATELALNRNATDGINFVSATFPLQPGDEVITSNEEHPAMVLPWLAACEKQGATLRFIDVSPDPLEFKKNLSDVLSSKTRLIAVSHVSCETGVRLPVAALRETVSPDVAILIDASQSVGQFPVNVPELNADFVIGNGHKWLAGPKGTGFAWFNPHSKHCVTPAHVASDSFEPTWTRNYYQHEPAPQLQWSDSPRAFEFGTRAWHLYGALHDAIEYQSALGWEAIEQHVCSLTTELKTRLNKLKNVSLASPREWADSSGLVTFSIDGYSGVEASQILWNDYNIVQRRVEVPPAVRVSIAYFTATEDLDRLASAVEQLASAK